MTDKNILRLNSVTLGLLWGVIADPGPRALAGREPVQDEVGYWKPSLLLGVHE
jgi:hypothetical protein